MAKFRAQLFPTSDDGRRVVGDYIAGRDPRGEHLGEFLEQLAWSVCCSKNMRWIYHCATADEIDDAKQVAVLKLWEYTTRNIGIIRPETATQYLYRRTELSIRQELRRVRTRHFREDDVMGELSRRLQRRQTPSRGKLFGAKLDDGDL